MQITTLTNEQISQCYVDMQVNRKDIKKIIRFNEKLIDILDYKIAKIMKKNKPSRLLVQYWTLTISLLEEDNVQKKDLRDFLKKQRKFIASAFSFISEH